MLLTEYIFLFGLYFNFTATLLCINILTGFPNKCPNCNKGYKHKGSVYNHLKYECGKGAGVFTCQVCNYIAKQKHNLYRHLKLVHHIDKADWNNHSLISHK